MSECDKTPTAEAEGYGVKLRTKGYRTLDLAWVLVLGAVTFFGFEARAHYTEMRSLAERQIASNTLLACIVSRPDADKTMEFAMENSWCNRMARGMK